jgi:hypothetical protein
MGGGFFWGGVVKIDHAAFYGYLAGLLLVFVLHFIGIRQVIGRYSTGIRQICGRCSAGICIAFYRYSICIRDKYLCRIPHEYIPM